MVRSFRDFYALMWRSGLAGAGCDLKLRGMPYDTISYEEQQ